MTTQNHDEFYDVVVMGCGPGGSTLAAYLARAGLSVLALEKAPFPRYHIGESLTGMVADVLEDFNLEPEMERLQFPPKGGVKVLGRDAKSEFFVPVLRPTWQVQACGGAEDALQWGLEQINPDLGWRVQGREQTESVRTITNYAYTVAPYVGPGWLCIGDAHRFTDPIFSFGVSFAMLEARAASQAIQRAMREGDDQAAFADYAAYCDRGQNAAADVIRYFWKFPTFFGYQSRSAMRKDVMRLLASDFHDVDEMRALQVMRRALNKYHPAA